VLIISDVHAAFGALERVAHMGEPLLVLGDLVNLIDYRTTEGIVPDVVGRDVVLELAAMRRENRADEAAALWRDHITVLGIDVPSEVIARMDDQYAQMHTALEGTEAYVTFGNADDPDLLRSHLPTGAAFVDGVVVEIEGNRVGFVGGGIPRVGSAGEVSDHEMRKKLDALGEVDILCTHIPPAVPMLAEDVVAGLVKGSDPVLEYIDVYQPRLHFFGDVHQPRALRWRRGRTECRNVGYFRATGRPYRHSDR
jgi:Icc-related predicted phosphoesterase